MLTKVKLALRITTTAFDSELYDLIIAALIDLGIAGVNVPEVIGEYDADTTYEEGNYVISDNVIYAVIAECTNVTPPNTDYYTEYLTINAILCRAIITYCKLHFGEPDEYDRLKASYDEQKAQLSMATGYTVWSEEE